MDPNFRPDLHNTAPPVDIPPNPSWSVAFLCDLLASGGRDVSD